MCPLAAWQLTWPEYLILQLANAESDNAEAGITTGRGPVDDPEEIASTMASWGTGKGITIVE